MKVLTATVRDGRLEVPEGTLQEGDLVTLLVPEEDDDGFEVTADERERLLAAIKRAQRGQGLDGWQLLDEICG